MESFKYKIYNFKDVIFIIINNMIYYLSII